VQCPCVTPHEAIDKYCFHASGTRPTAAVIHA
jgi:hypothetical protein